MKKICFIEMEGVLASFGNYSPNERRVRLFLEDLTAFCKKNKVEVFLITGHSADFALKKFSSEGLDKFFDDVHFLFVNEEYLSKKAELDKKVYDESLAKNPEFVDTYFKQVIIPEVLKKKNLLVKDAVLLSDDIWVDAYYTIRFSKIDFAIFEENILDRGKPVERISGLAYFGLDFASVKQLLEKFPATDNSALEKYVFESMKKALVGDDLADAIKKGLEKKMGL